MARPWPTTPPTAHERAAVDSAARRPYWLDGIPARAPYPPLRGVARAELVIIGGGFSGLWAAIHAKAIDPGRDVLLLEGGSLARAASGRNGGFCSNSLTHGLANGASHYGEELATLDARGRDNLAGLLGDLDRLEIDAHIEHVPEAIVALEPQHLTRLEDEVALHRRYGYDAELLDQPAMQARVASPTYAGGALVHGAIVLVDPGRLADGLRAAAERLGVRLHEGSAATHITASGSALTIDVQATVARGGLRLGRPAGPAAGQVRAERAVLATGAHRSLLPAVRRRIATVYDYVLVTEPLSAEQWRAVGWAGREGISDYANQFHYYRPTRDGRILWGGYDAVHEFASAVHHRRDHREASLLRLAQHFFATFPQLRGLAFSHAWGGAIDTCTRFAPFFGTAHGGRVAYVAGYTGLGVGASRWGGQVAVDLVDGRRTPSTTLAAVHRRPLPFPPEPLRTPAIALTQAAMERADAAGGRRGRLLRAMDALGVGFDS